MPMLSDMKDEYTVPDTLEYFSKRKRVIQDLSRVRDCAVLRPHKEGPDLIIYEDTIPEFYQDVKFFNLMEELRHRRGEESIYTIPPQQILSKLEWALELDVLNQMFAKQVKIADDAPIPKALPLSVYPKVDYDEDVCIDIAPRCIPMVTK